MLSLALALPNPAYALKPQEAAEGNVEQELKRALTSVNTRVLTDRITGLVGTVVPSAGLEEKEPAWIDFMTEDAVARQAAAGKLVAKGVQGLPVLTDVFQNLSLDVEYLDEARGALRKIVANDSDGAIDFLLERLNDHSNWKNPRGAALVLGALGAKVPQKDRVVAALQAVLSIETLKAREKTFKRSVKRRDALLDAHLAWSTYALTGVASALVRIDSRLGKQAIDRFERECLAHAGEVRGEVGEMILEKIRRGNAGFEESPETLRVQLRFLSKSLRKRIQDDDEDPASAIPAALQEFLTNQAPLLGMIGSGISADDFLYVIMGERGIPLDAQLQNAYLAHPTALEAHRALPDLVSALAAYLRTNNTQTVSATALLTDIETGNNPQPVPTMLSLRDFSGLIERMLEVTASAGLEEQEPMLREVSAGTLDVPIYVVADALFSLLDTASSADDRAAGMAVLPNAVSNFDSSPTGKRWRLESIPAGQYLGLDGVYELDHLIEAAIDAQGVVLIRASELYGEDARQITPALIHEERMHLQMAREITDSPALFERARDAILSSRRRAVTAVRRVIEEGYEKGELDPNTLAMELIPAILVHAAERTAEKRIREIFPTDTRDEVRRWWRESRPSERQVAQALEQARRLQVHAGVRSYHDQVVEMLRERLEAPQGPPPQTAGMEEETKPPGGAISTSMPSDLLGSLLGVMNDFFAAQDETAVEQPFVRSAREVLGYSGAVLYLVRQSEKPNEFQILSEIRALEGMSAAASWSPATHEKKKALESGVDDLYVEDRQKADFVDQTLLAKDAQTYAGGNLDNVRSVYYVVLRDADHRPWGLLMVNNWKSGAPLFPGQSEAETEAYRLQVLRILQTVGNAALFARQNVRNYRLYRNAMNLEKEGQRITGILHDLKNRLAGVSASAELFSMDFESEAGVLYVLAQEVQRFIIERAEEARVVMRLAGKRPVKKEPPAQARKAPSLQNLEVFDKLFHSVSLDFLEAVRDLDPEEVRALYRRHLDDPGLKDNPEAQRILAAWEALASSAIAAVEEWDDENQKFIPQLQTFIARFKGVREFASQLRAIAEKESDQEIAADVRKLADRVDRVVQEANQFLADIGATIEVDLGKISQPAEQIHVDVGSILREEIESRAGQFTLRYDSLQWTQGGGVLYVSPEESRLIRSTLVELLENTSKYRRQDKALEVAVTAVYSPADRTVEVTVEDNGIGIPAKITVAGEEKSREEVLFQHGQRLDRPETAGTQGTGYGLSSLSNELTKRSGVLELVRSVSQAEAGAAGTTGSVFRFRLPVTVQKGPVSEESQEEPRGAAAILGLEDELKKAAVPAEAEGEDFMAFLEQAIDQQIAAEKPPADPEKPPENKPNNAGAGTEEIDPAVRNLLNRLFDPENNSAQRMNLLVEQAPAFSAQQRVSLTRSLLWLSDTPEVQGFLRGIFLADTPPLRQARAAVLEGICGDETGQSIRAFLSVWEESPSILIDVVLKQIEAEIHPSGQWAPGWERRGPVFLLGIKEIRIQRAIEEIRKAGSLPEMFLYNDLTRAMEERAQLYWQGLLPETPAGSAQIVQKTAGFAYFTEGQIARRLSVRIGDAPKPDPSRASSPDPVYEAAMRSYEELKKAFETALQNPDRLVRYEAYQQMILLETLRADALLSISDARGAEALAVLSQAFELRYRRDSLVRQVRAELGIGRPEKPDEKVFEIFGVELADSTQKISPVIVPHVRPGDIFLVEVDTPAGKKYFFTGANDRLNTVLLDEDDITVSREGFRFEGGGVMPVRFPRRPPPVGAKTARIEALDMNFRYDPDNGLVFAWGPDTPRFRVARLAEMERVSFEVLALEIADSKQQVSPVSVPAAGDGSTFLLEVNAAAGKQRFFVIPSGKDQIVVPDEQFFKVRTEGFSAAPGQKITIVGSQRPPPRFSEFVRMETLDLNIRWTEEGKMILIGWGPDTPSFSLSRLKGIPAGLEEKPETAVLGEVTAQLSDPGLFQRAVNRLAAETAAVLGLPYDEQNRTSGTLLMFLVQELGKNLLEHVPEESHPSAALRFSIERVVSAEGKTTGSLVVTYRDENPGPWKIPVDTAVRVAGSTRKTGFDEGEAGIGLSASYLAVMDIPGGSLTVETAGPDGGRIRYLYTAAGEAPAIQAVERAQGSEIIFRLPVSVQGGSIQEVAAQIRDAFSKAGLEEKSTARVWTLEKMGRKGVELAAEAGAQGYTQAVLVPVGAVLSRMESATLDLYAQPSVSSAAMAILPDGWGIGQILAIPENDPSAGNDLLRKATDEFTRGRQVVIALDPDLKSGLQLPQNHPVALLLSEKTYHLIDRTILAAFLSQPQILRNLILDLTRGTIERVTIDGEDYFAIFA